MNRRLPSAEAIAPALLLVLGSGALYGAIDMGVGTPSVPDAGFFPLLASLSLVALSVFMLAAQLRGGMVTDPAPTEEPKTSGRSALAVILGLVAYVPILDRLGFLIATGMLVALLLLVFGIRKPLAYIVSVPLVAGGSYLLFHIILGLPLPVGPGGF